MSVFTTFLSSQTVSSCVSPPQARGLFRSSWRPTSSRLSRSGSGSWEPGSSGRWSLQSLPHCLLLQEGNGSVTRGARGRRSTERDSHSCKAAQRKVHLHTRLHCNTDTVNTAVYERTNYQGHWLFSRSKWMRWILVRDFICYRFPTINLFKFLNNWWRYKWVSGASLKSQFTQTTKNIFSPQGI